MAVGRHVPGRGGSAIRARVMSGQIWADSAVKRLFSALSPLHVIGSGMSRASLSVQGAIGRSWCQWQISPTVPGWRAAWNRGIAPWRGVPAGVRMDAIGCREPACAARSVCGGNRRIVWQRCHSVSYLPSQSTSASAAAARRSRLISGTARVGRSTVGARSRSSSSSSSAASS